MLAILKLGLVLIMFMAGSWYYCVRNFKIIALILSLFVASNLWHFVFNLKFQTRLVPKNTVMYHMSTDNFQLEGGRSIFLSENPFYSVLERFGPSDLFFKALNRSSNFESFIQLQHGNSRLYRFTTTRDLHMLQVEDETMQMFLTSLNTVSNNNHNADGTSVYRVANISTDWFTWEPISLTSRDSLIPQFPTEPRSLSDRLRSDLMFISLRFIFTNILSTIYLYFFSHIK